MHRYVHLQKAVGVTFKQYYTIQSYEPARKSPKTAWWTYVYDETTGISDANISNTWSRTIKNVLNSCTGLGGKTADLLLLEMINYRLQLLLSILLIMIITYIESKKIKSREAYESAKNQLLDECRQKNSINCTVIFESQKKVNGDYSVVNPK